MPIPKANTLAERYDRSLRYARGKKVLLSPVPTCHWSRENILLYESYRAWLLGGGTCEYSTKTIYLPIAGHVLGLNLKPHTELNLDSDLQKALAYVRAKGVSKDWIKACKNGLNIFRRYLRLQRGLGEENKITAFDSTTAASDLPLWLVRELERYQHLMQRNWRTARVEQNIRRFWSGYLRMFRFFDIKDFADLKRKHILDYVDHRLAKKYSVNGVNADLRYFHTFLLFLQEEGYTVTQSLLKMPSLKQPEPLPKYLTDEQVQKLRDEVQRRVITCQLASHKRLAILVRAAFYLLWQGGMRLGEVEEIRLEDLDLKQKRLSVRDGKGRKDRTVYLTETAIHALEEYLAVRGEGSGDHVFLYRNAPLKKDIIRAQLGYVGERVGVKIYPHRLRHTCATQLLNAGCKVTSIQRFLGHKELSSTMIYAKAHDQTVADDYFSAMQRVEERLELVEQKDKDVKVQMVFQLIQRLEIPELCFEERIRVASQLRQAFGNVHEHAPPKDYSLN